MKELTQLELTIYDCVTGKFSIEVQRIITVTSDRPFQAYWTHEKPIQALNVTETEVQTACLNLESVGLFHRRVECNKDIFYVSSPVEIVAFKLR